MTVSVLLSSDILDNSPSKQIGIPEDIEYEYRVFGCQLIREACIRLKLSCVVSASGQVLFQRFYYKRTLNQYHPFFVALGCLYLATKLEEEVIHIGRLIRCFYLMFLQRQKQPFKLLDKNDPIYILWNHNVIRIEQLVLYMNEYRMLSLMDHPHRFILLFVKKIDGTRDIAQEAWNICNDLLSTNISLCFPSYAIATAAIYIASQKFNITLPPCVLTLFSTSEDEVNQISQCLNKLYTTQIQSWYPSIQQYFIDMKSKNPDSSLSLKDSNYVLVPPLSIPSSVQIKQQDICIDFREKPIQAPTLEDLQPPKENNNETSNKSRFTGGNDSKMNKDSVSERKDGHKRDQSTRHRSSSHHKYSSRDRVYSRDRSYSRDRRRDDSRRRNDSRDRRRNDSRDRRRDDSRRRNDSRDRRRNDSRDRRRNDSRDRRRDDSRKRNDSRDRRRNDSRRKDDSKTRNNSHNNKK